MVLHSEERPWGSWYVLDEDTGYKVKRIHVHSGARLSYQSHAHRSEHWVVLTGQATAIIDDVEITAGPGESIDVPCGAKHRLVNNAERELIVIEVQRGAYTGEDDIVRYEDDYGRTPAN
jgi:mannose-6-phosphate isomerase-like protein (cupin superfamily)